MCRTGAAAVFTRIATANYWHRYGASDVWLWLTLIGEDGNTICQWDLDLPNSPGGVTIDSTDVTSDLAWATSPGNCLFTPSA